jgi:hypothetical protein
MTKPYIQVVFPEGTNFFILKKLSKIIISNPNAGLRKIMALNQIQRKNMSEKMNKQFDIMTKFL